MNKLIILILCLISGSSLFPLMAYAVPPERSWYIPQTVRETRKMPPSQVSPQLADAVELVEQARLIAALDRDGMDYDTLYSRWQKADDLFRQVEEKYLPSNDIRLKRLVAYAMNKRSLLACRLAVHPDDEYKDEKTQERLDALIKQLFTEFGHEKDPEIRRCLTEALVDYAINTMLASSFDNDGKKENDFYNDIHELVKDHLDDEDILFQWARFISECQHLSITKRQELLPAIDLIIDKGWQSEHPGLGLMIVNLVFTRDYIVRKDNEENEGDSRNVDLVLWRYGGSSDPEMQARLAGLIANSIHYRKNIEEQRKYADFLWERWKDSNEESIQNTIIEGMNNMIEAYQEQGMDKEALPTIEKVICQLKNSPHPRVLCQLLEYYERKIKSQLKGDNLNVALSTCDEMETVYNRMPQGRYRNLALGNTMLKKIQILESSGQVNETLTAYEKYLNEFENYPEMISNIKNKKDKIIKWISLITK